MPRQACPPCRKGGKPHSVCWLQSHGACKSSPICWRPERLRHQRSNSTPPRSTCRPTMPCVVRRQPMNPRDSTLKTPRGPYSVCCMRLQSAKAGLRRQSMSARPTMDFATAIKATRLIRPIRGRTSTCRCWPTGSTMPQHLGSHRKTAAIALSMHCTRR